MTSPKYILVFLLAISTAFAQSMRPLQIQASGTGIGQAEAIFWSNDSNKSAIATALAGKTISGAILSNVTFSGSTVTINSGSDSTKFAAGSDTRFSIPTAQKGGSVFYVFEGDSMTAPGGTGGSLLASGEDYPSYLMAASNFVGTGSSVNQAVGGEPIASLRTQYATQVYPYRPSAIGKDKVYLFVWTFNNDYDSRDEASIWNDWSIYSGSARADGFTIVTMTIPKRRPPSSNGLSIQKPEQEVARQNLNSRLKKQYADGEIILVDVDRILPGPFGSNTGYNSDWSIDGTHFTARGNRLIAAHINSVVWPGKGQEIRTDDQVYRRPVIIASEQVGSGTNAGTTVSSSWNSRTLNVIDVDTDDLARIVRTLEYTYSGSSGLIVRQTITGSTSGATAFVIAKNESAGVGQMWLVEPVGTFTASEVITSPSFTGTVTTYSGNPTGDIYLPPGTYQAEASTVSIESGVSKTSLYNQTDSAVLLEGLTVASGTSNFVGVSSPLAGQFTLSASRMVRLRTYTTNGRSSYGKGLTTSSGTADRYSILKLEKVN